MTSDRTPGFPCHRPGEAFRLVQISDCHLSASAATPYRGKNADAGLLSLVHTIAEWQPHLVLATGDLSEDASSASYQRLAQHFRLMRAPVCVLPGNHDDNLLMRRYLQTGPWNGPLILQAGDWQLVLLDSAVAGRIDGILDRDHVQQLRRCLVSRTKRPVLLALHHQPVPVGALWIDRYMLKDPDALLELVADHEQVRGVVCGHVHQAFESCLGNAKMLACPSSAANSRAGASRFVHDPAGPACRWLQLTAQGKIETGLLYAC